MCFVEKTEGAYGILLMTNIFTNVKADSIDDSAIDMIRVVLLHEASVMFHKHLKTKEPFFVVFISIDLVNHFSAN